ncbi:MAG: hypothetical protein KGL93_03050 [Gemmatimonadota bacterium]|nr:hypothetical protein [Gemmatimonadota bacterium]
MGRMSFRALVLTFAVAGLAPVGVGAQATITITARMSGRAIGPDTAAAVAMPAGVGASRSDGRTRATGGTAVHEPVVLTMRPGRAEADFERLAALGARGHPAVGVCDLVFRTAAGAVFRTEHLAGCVVTRVEAEGPMRRISLDYTSISTS